MAADKRWRLLCYDIRDPRRYRKVHRLVRGSGRSVQYSIFRARLDDRELERLRWELARVMDAEDALLVVDLCPSCATRVIAKNTVDDWAEEEPTFVILRTPAQDQAPPDVECSAASKPCKRLSRKSLAGGRDELGA